MRSLNPFLAVLFGGSPHLIRINIAGEAGYERTVRVTQDEDARVTDYIQDVARGQPRGSILTVSRFLHRYYYWVGLLVGRPRYGSPNFLEHPYHALREIRAQAKTGAPY